MEAGVRGLRAASAGFSPSGNFLKPRRAGALPASQLPGAEAACAGGPQEDRPV